MRSLFARLHRRYGPRISGAERQSRVRDKLDSQPALPSLRLLATHTALARPRPKVAIIGGGFSGLMAASELVAHCDVTVFEARDRFGGRVWSKKKNSGIVEAGGELIGYNHPIWLSLAKRFELGLSVITSDTNFDALDLKMPLRLGDHEPTEGQLERIYHEMDHAFKTISRQAAEIDSRKPWRAKDAKDLDDRTLGEWIDGLDCSKLTKLAIDEQMSNDQGVPTHEQSFLANLAVISGGRMKDQADAFFTQTETLRCSEGNQQLAIRLAEVVNGSAGSSAVLSAPVSAIRIEDEGVTLEFAAVGDAALRTPFRADYVVLAIPPSLWPASRSAKIKITPDLPRDYYITMGTAVKYLSTMKKRFWIGEGRAPTSMSTEFGVTWEGTDNQIAPPERPVELSVFAGAESPRTRSRVTSPVTRRRSIRSMRTVSASSTRAIRHISTAHRNSWPGRATNGPPRAIPVLRRARSAGPGRYSTRVSKTACSSPASTPALPISVTWKARSNPAGRQLPRSSAPSANTRWCSLPQAGRSVIG